MLYYVYLAENCASLIARMNICIIRATGSRTDYGNLGYLRESFVAQCPNYML